MEADNAYCITNMQDGHQESNLMLDGSEDHPDMVKDEISTENCSVSSPSQSHDNVFSSKYVPSDAAAVGGSNSKCVENGAVSPFVTCNESTSEREKSGKTGSDEGRSVGALDTGDINPLLGAVAALDICGYNRNVGGKFTSSSLKEEYEQHESGSFLHHNQVCKIPCSGKDLMSKSTDKATEIKEVYQEMKSESACSLQPRSINFLDSTTSVGSSLCSHNSHISETSNSVVSDHVNKSPYPHTVDISLPLSDMKFSFNCNQDATTPSFFGKENKVESAHVSLSGGVIIDQSKVNYVTLPSEILVPPVITKFPCDKLEVIKMNADSEEKMAKCCPSESANMPQTHTNTTGITVIAESRETLINTTSSVEAAEAYVSFTGIVPRELSGSVSISTSQPDIHRKSVGISTSAPNLQTCGLLEPFLSQNVGLSKSLPLLSAGIFDCNTSRSKTSLLQPEVSFVSKTKNSGSFPNSAAIFTAPNRFYQNVADKAKSSFSVSPKSEQNSALRVTGVSSSIPTSKNSFAADIPLRFSSSPDSSILKSTNDSSVAVLNSLSRNSSVDPDFFQFCTRNSPVSLSAVSKPVATNFHLGTTSSDLKFSLGSGTSFKCRTPCTETSVDSAQSSMCIVGSTCLKSGFMWSGANVNLSKENTLQQNRQDVTTESVGIAASAFVSHGTPDFSTVTTQSLSFSDSSAVSVDQLGRQVPRIENTSTVSSTGVFPAVTTKTSSFPNSSVMSTGLFEQVSRIVNTRFVAFLPNITTGASGLQLSNQASALDKGPEFSRFSHCSSKPLFGSDVNFSKYESVKDTSVRKNVFGSVFQVNSPDVQSSTEKASNETALSNGNRKLFTFGATELKHDDTNTFNKDFKREPVTAVASDNFSTDIIDNKVTSGILSPLTSGDVLFNFSGSDKMSKRKSKLHIQGRSKLHLQGRSCNSEQTRSCFHSRIQKPSVPFRVVRDTDTQIKNGVVRLIAVQHQHITAMPEYSSLSFEELRLQFYEYEAVMVNKEVQTTENFWKDGSHLADIWKALECPVCLDIVTAPVLQCQRGHHVCNNCWKRVFSCPLCKCNNSETRNYVAEAMIEKLLLPCKYRVDGCSETMLQVEKAAHEKACLFRSYTCLVDDCNQVHTFKDMMVHLNASHSHLITGNYFHIPEGKKFTHIMSKYSFQSLVHVFDLPGWGLFFLCHKGFEQNTCLWMQVMNTDATDTKFLYTIELANTQALRSVSYQGPVVPLNTVINREQHDCLVLTDPLLSTLKTNFGFHITVSIWKNEF